MKYWLLQIAYGVWEYWLGKTKKIAANSTIDLIISLISRLLRREQKMEQDAKLGEVGAVKFTFSGGIGRVELSAAIPGSTAVAGGAFVQADSDVVLDELFKVIEQHSPAGLVAIEEGAKVLIKAAVKKL